MSRTNKTLDGPIHPCKLWLQWNSDGTIWKAWDKAQSQNQYYEWAGLRFIVLDVLSTLTGFSSKANKGYYSNEVRSVNQKFRLMCGGQLMTEDVWANIKTMFPDVKFSASVYAMVKGGEIAEYTMANFKLSGASLGSWIEFVRTVGGNRGLYENIICGVQEIAHDKAGKVEYSFPKFAVMGKTLTPEAAAKADEMDISLQAYLDHYFNKGDSDPHPDEPETPRHEDNYNGAPF
jgi:hypothetical protein